MPHHEITLASKLAKRKKELKEIYFAVSMKSLALSLIGLFIPLYLLKELNYGFNEIIYFYIWIVCASIFFAPLVGKLISKVGIKHSMLMASPFYVASLFFVYFLKDGLIHYSVPAILYAIAFSLFWVAFHSEFARCSSKKSRGTETGIWYALNFLGAIVGPLLGGAILTHFGGFLTLFAVASIFFLTSSFSLVSSKDTKLNASFSFKYLFARNHFRDIIAFLAYGIRHYMLTVFWPIFIFLLFGSYLYLGSFGTLVGIIAVLFALFIGKLSDVIPRHKIIEIGALINSFSWLIRLFVRSFANLVGFTALGIFSFMTVEIPLYSKIEEKAAKNKKKLVEYIVFKEIWIGVGRLLLLLVILITFNFLNFYINDVNSLIQYSILSGVLLASFAPIAWMFY